MKSTSATVHLARAGSTLSLTVAGFSGARPTVGATGHQSGSGSAPSVTLTPQSSGSLFWGTGRVIGSRYDPKPPSGQAIVHDETFTSPSTGYWTQRTTKTRTTTAGTPVTLSDKAAATSWGYSAVEVRGLCA